MSYTWLVPEPLSSFFDNRIFGKQMSASRAIAALHALEYLVHTNANDALRDIKSLEQGEILSEKTRVVLGSDLERAFRVSASLGAKRHGVWKLVDDVLVEKDGSFEVQRGVYQGELQRALFLGGKSDAAVKAAQHLGLVRQGHEAEFVEIRQSRDFAIPNHPRFQSFFTMLAAGRLTNEKGFSARLAELVVFGTRIENGQPILDFE